jgi:hypothetical protein
MPKSVTGTARTASVLLAARVMCEGMPLEHTSRVRGVPVPNVSTILMWNVDDGRKGSIIQLNGERCMLEDNCKIMYAAAI